MINQVHDVLLALGRISKVLVVFVICKIVLVLKDAGLNIARHSQYAVLLKSTQCFCTISLILALDSVEEMNLELGPAGFNVEFVYFLAQ